MIMSSFSQKFKNIWNPPEDEADYEEVGQVQEEEVAEEAHETSGYESYRDIHSDSHDDHRVNNVVNFTSSSSMQVILYKLEKFNTKEMKKIADKLIQGHSIVLNLEATEKDGKPQRNLEKERILDFMGGVIYAKNGDMQPIANNTFFITPHNIDLTGGDLTDQDELEEPVTYF
jgi:cell division inhibitor SepF